MSRLAMALVLVSSTSALAKGVEIIPGAKLTEVQCALKPNLSGKEGTYQIDGTLRFAAPQGSAGKIKDSTLFLRGSSHEKELAGKRYTTNAGFCDGLQALQASRKPVTLLYSWSAIGSVPVLVGFVGPKSGTIVEGLGDVSAGEKY